MQAFFLISLAFTSSPALNACQAINFSFLQFLLLLWGCILFFFFSFAFFHFSRFLIIRGYDTFYCKNKRMQRQCHIYHTSERLGSWNYAQISNLQEEFKSGAGLWISIKFLFSGRRTFYCIISCIVRILICNVIELSFNVSYMILCCI